MQHKMINNAVVLAKNSIDSKREVTVLVISQDVPEHSHVNVLPISRTKVLQKLAEKFRR